MGGLRIDLGASFRSRLARLEEVARLLRGGT
jgi:hypothetical protein